LEIRWLVFIGLGFRILLDFSGYSDMAIGFSRMMGVKVPENFNWPYLATGPIEFWRRWHISLSSWIRDYIYIPLGGNRVSLTRKITNGLIAFAVCGLWHGAGWNFIVWGLYHGIGITVNNLWNERFGHYSVYSWLRIPNRVFCWSLNIFFVFVGWVIFFYDLPKAMTILRLLWGFK
jgi:alginate O-acetyltransferase complex protein AlgI